MKLKKIINLLEKEFPPTLAEEWDNVGLMVGEGSAEISKVQISLDITDEVIENAVINGVNLIITHHPMIFKGIKNINDSTKMGKRIIKLIKEGIAVYSLHTNLDSAENGLNNYIALKLGMESGKITEPHNIKFFKVKLFLPVEDSVRFKERLIKESFMNGENYSGVIYISEYKEEYTVGELASPFKGESGNRSFNRATAIEFIVEESKIKECEEFIKNVHPYQEPAYEIVDSGRRKEIGGIGRVFNLKEPVTIYEYAEMVKKALNIESVKLVYGGKEKIKRVGVVNGSGADYISKMKKMGVELFVTADVKYHEAQMAAEYEMSVIDAGHFESEIIFSEIISKKLKDTGVETVVFHGESIFKRV